MTIPTASDLFGAGLLGSYRLSQITRPVITVLLSIQALLCWNAHLPAQPASIWGELIAPQPFETQPFHAIRIPGWVEDTVGCGYTLSVMDTQARERAAQHGVTISEVGFVDPFYAYYDSKLLKRRSPHVSPDALRKQLAEYKRLGVHPLAVYPPCLQGEVYQEHPEWRRIDRDTKEIPQIDLVKFPHGGMLCLLGPYGDFMIEVLAEILTAFPEVDAFSFDGLHYGGVCYCQFCREGFRAASGGKEIPPTNLDDPEFRRYQHWADRQMEHLVQRMQSRLKAIKPEVALVTWTTNAGRFGHFLSIPRNMPSRMNLLLDAPDQEFWLDETNRGATVVPAFANAYIWATTNHRVAFSEPYLMTHGNPYSKDSFPAIEVLHRMMLALTYGASPSIAVSQPAHLQAAVYSAMDEVQKRRPWLTHKSPEPWAALLMSDNTKNFYGRRSGAVEERYLSSVLGMFRMAIEEHLPVTVINDWNLNELDLSRYDLLLLPNAACMDAGQLEAVTKFVAKGGGLVASLDTSLCDEFGTPRKDYGLANLFGVSHAGPIQTLGAKAEIDANFALTLDDNYWAKRKNTFLLSQSTKPAFGSDRLSELLGSAAVTFKGPSVAVRPTPTSHVNLDATLQLPDQAAGVEPYPAIISRSHGEGRLVFMPAGLDAAYYLYAYPYQRVLLRDAARWAARRPAPLTLKAPMCVHSSIMRQRADDHDRLIVHLYNDVNTTAFHALPNEDVPLREEILPIHEIELHLTFPTELASGKLSSFDQAGQPR